MYGFGGLGHFLVQILKFIYDGGGAVLCSRLLVFLVGHCHGSTASLRDGFRLCHTP